MQNHKRPKYGKMAGQAVELAIDPRRDDHVKALIDNAKTKKDRPVLAAAKIYKKFSVYAPNPLVEILDYRGHLVSKPSSCRVREYRAGRELASKVADATHPFRRYISEDSGELVYDMHAHRTTHREIIKYRTHKKKASHATHLRTLVDVKAGDWLHYSHMKHRHNDRYSHKYSRAIRSLSMVDPTK